ncbi:hypothetical protein [Bradyrhizobium sp.]|jgi:hypothetical protein|uniref:hypothetical protein n=1 Tax=Bradyrhizobium sp. TaxID=376 RepID=UPI003D148D4A
MPLLRYFLFVGAALLALLFVVDAYLPKLPVADRANATNTAANTATGVSVIRIHSDRKWPERVEFDTSLPTVTAAPVRTAEASAPAMVADAAAPVRMRDAFAQLQTPALLQTSEPKKPETKLPPKRRMVAGRTVAKSRVGPPTILVAQQPRLGLFANTIW